MKKNIIQPSLFDYIEENNINNKPNEIKKKKSKIKFENTDILNKNNQKLSFLDEEFINKQKAKELKNIIKQLQQIYISKNFYFEEILKNIPFDNKDKIEIIHKSLNEFNSFYKSLIKMYKKYPEELKEFVKVDKKRHFNINGFKIPFENNEKNIDTEYIYNLLDLDKELLDIIFKNREFLNDQRYFMLNEIINKYIENSYEKLKEHNDNIEIKIENFTKKYGIKNSKITFTRTMVTNKEYAKHTLAVNKKGIVQTKSINPKHKKGSKELEELLKAVKNNKYLSELEIDSQVDLKKLTDFIKHLDKINMIIDFPLILKIRPLGNYGALGLHIKIKDRITNENTYIIALDPKNPEAFIHELTHLIDIQKLDKNENIEERNAIIKYFEQQIDTHKIPLKRREYFLNDKEIIARLGEIYWYLKSKENLNIANIKNKEGIIPIINTEKFYIENKNVYFNFDKWTKKDKEILNKFFDNYYLKKELNLDYKEKLLKQQDKILTKTKNKKNSYNHLPLLFFTNKNFQKLYLRNINNINQEKYKEELPYYMYYFYNIAPKKFTNNVDEGKINQIYFKINKILQKDKLKNIGPDNVDVDIETLFENINKYLITVEPEVLNYKSVAYGPLSIALYFSERLKEKLEELNISNEEKETYLKAFKQLENIRNNIKNIDKQKIIRNDKIKKYVPIIDIKQYEDKEKAYNAFMTNYVLFPNKIYQNSQGFLNCFIRNMYMYLSKNQEQKPNYEKNIELN